ncbi:hypothetical protein QCA50_018292 [Cerrena zonata]|uniref:Uncharacterized protein n=1 Tax=Cerrena zonata TaxID=2478898 RepID=A0AAW0FI51_9APHY
MASPSDPERHDASETNALLISGGSDLERPPLLVKLTAYRILNVSIITAFGVTKAIFTYKGYSALPTTLDWILGVILTVLYVHNPSKTANA